MKPDDFEKQLGKVPIRPIPQSWRKGILAAAQDAAAVRSRCSAPARSWWRELLWPCPQAWAGLAAAWVLILAAQFGGDQPHTGAVSQSAKAAVPLADDPIITAGLSERVWAKLIDDEEPAPAALPKPAALPRRSFVQSNQVIV